MSRPVYFALAMNTYMYEHFLTEEQKEKLINKFKFFEIPTQIKKLACGDYGIMIAYQ
jgi:phosphopantothenoylcysteine synthetase/decarboxylase